MKKTIAAIVSLAAVASFAATYQIDFNPSTSPNVSYRIYSSTNMVNWKFERAITNTSVLLTNIAANVVGFGISATNSTGESAKSTGEILLPPSNVKIIELP